MPVRLHKLWCCLLAVLALAALCAFGAAADTTVGVTGAGTFKMEQAYVNVPELDVYFYALNGDGDPYSSIQVQAAGPELTLGDRKLEVRSVGIANDPICYIVALDNSSGISTADFYTMLGGVRKLIAVMGENDQLMLYTTAGATECVLPATSDKDLMYKALAHIQQAEGSMDTAQLVSAVYSEIQSDYQALAPRKAAMIVTDAGQVLSNMALFGTLASDVGDQIGMAAYVYLMTEEPKFFETLAQAADGKLVLCEASTLGDELKKKQAYFATALEIRTEVPESMYGERLETLTLAMPQLGSAIKNSQTVYMGYKLTKPQVTNVETLRRDKLRLTFNQPIHENADKIQLYEIRSKDIWNWRVQVKSVEIAEDGRTATLEIEPLYKGEYTVAQAERDPMRNYIGIDIKGARMWRGARTATDRKMPNVGFLRTRIEFINALFAEGEVAEIWITFPDPQLKTRRARKRLTSPVYLAYYAGLLQAGGAINLKTDSKHLYVYTAEVIRRFGLPCEVSEPDIYGTGRADEVLSIKTAYEERFLGMGLPITYPRFSLGDRRDFPWFDWEGDDETEKDSEAERQLR